MDGGWEKVREEVTCGICLGIFKEPKMLPCLHTFCAKCLQVLWQQADRRRVVRCPQCRAAAPAIGFSVKALPLNFSAARLVDIVEMQHRLNEETPPTCQSCQDKKDAVASCAPCGIFLCKSCLGVHKTLKLTSSHQINSLDDIKSGKVTVPSILDHSQEMCSIHPDKPLELYCKRDKCLICLGCAVVKHRSHDYDFISQIAKEQKEEVFSTLPNFREHMRRVKQIATEVKLMQDQVEERRRDNVYFINRAFLEITNVLSARKKQLLDEVEKTTASRMKALNEQHEDLLNLYDQMNSYLELVEIKLKSERDRAIVAMKDQMINRGNSLLKVVRLKKPTPIETAPSKVEFPRLQNVLNLTKFLGMPLCSTLVEITRNSNEPTFQVRVRDLMRQPISNCASLLDVKIIPNKDSEADYVEVEVPKITNKGNGCYEFSTTCDNSLCHYTYGRMHPWGQRDSAITQRYGLVIVQLLGKDVPESPLKFKNGYIQ